MINMIKIRNRRNLFHEIQQPLPLLTILLPSYYYDYYNYYDYSCVSRSSCSRSSSSVVVAGVVVGK